MSDLLNIAVSNAVAATVLALLVLAVGAVYRRPALRHALWLLVLLKLVTPPLLFLPVSWPTADEPVPQEIDVVREEPTIASPLAVEELEAVVIVPVAGETDFSSVGAIGSPTSPPVPLPPQPSLWLQILTMIWGVGALAWFLLALERLHRFRQLIRFARPPSAALQERTRRLADSMRLKRCPRVRLLPGRIAPMLWAIGGSPRLLVPADLLPLLNDEQLDTLLLHELAHLRRRDHWVRVLEFVVMGLYWWHPVVWYARRELREAEEQCCDAWVVSTLPDAGRTYASALLDTLDFLSTAQAAVPPLASGLSHLVDLKRRLTMIMRGNTPRSLTWPGCLAIITLGLTVLPMLPSLHGQDPSKEEASKSTEDAQKEFQKAKAALERQKALLDQQKAILDLAAKRLAEAKEKADEQKKVQLGQQFQLQQFQEPIEIRYFDLHTEAAKKKKAAYRIVITLSPDEQLNPKEVAEKIRKILPEKLRGSVVLRPVDESQAFEYRLVVPKMHQAPAAVELRDWKAVPSGAGSSPDKRINELEKKLEKVLQELHELRKQMKESRSDSSIKPSPAHIRIVTDPPPDEDRPLVKPPVAPRSPENP